MLLLLKALREAGHQSILLARRKEPAVGCCRKPRIPGVCRSDVKEVWQHSRDADVVHAHDARAHTTRCLSIEMQIRGIAEGGISRCGDPIASKWKYQRAARFLAVSQFVARELEAAGIRKEKIDIVYDGVEPPEPTEEWRAEYPAVALASRDPQKGRDLVEQAAEIGRCARCVFGRSVQGIFGDASMFVYITRSEGLGSAALLAMNMGVPVIASCVGGLTEVLADGVSGILVRNDAHEIAQCDAEHSGGACVCPPTDRRKPRRVSESASP